MTGRIALAVAAASLALLGCGGEDEGAAPDRGPSVAEKLAQLETGGPVEATDPAVRRFDIALNRLRQSCSNARGELSDLIVRSRELLEDGGVDEDLLAIARRVGATLPEGRRDCTDDFAAYVTERKTLP